MEEELCLKEILKDVETIVKQQKANFVMSKPEVSFDETTVKKTRVLHEICEQCPPSQVIKKLQNENSILKRLQNENRLLHELVHDQLIVFNIIKTKMKEQKAKLKSEVFFEPLCDSGNTEVEEKIQEMRQVIAALCSTKFEDDLEQINKIRDENEILRTLLGINSH